MISAQVHFFGSIGHDSVKEVFQTLVPLFGSRLRRIPDGEPGGRRAWIGWQQIVLRLNPFLIFDPNSRSATINIPLPIARHNDAYFRPLSDLALKPETEIYLGLVHADGAGNVRARIAAAAKYVPSFGIATECGIARARKLSAVKQLIRAHAAVSQGA